MTTEFERLSTDDVAAHCLEEASQKDQQSRTNLSCFELLRRALGLEEKQALGHVFNIYKQYWSKRWIREPEAFEANVMTADDFKTVAFWNVYETCKGSRFSKFNSLNAFLAYLRKALVRIIAGYYRSSDMKKRIASRPMDENMPDQWEYIMAPDNPSEEVARKLLWQKIEKRIQSLLPDKDEQIFLDLWAKQRLPRREIVQIMPIICPDEDAVRKMAQKITRRLCKDTELLELLHGF